MEDKERLDPSVYRTTKRHSDVATKRPRRSRDRLRDGGDNPVCNWLCSGFVFPEAFFRKSLCGKQVRHFKLASFGNGAFSQSSILPPARRVDRARLSSLPPIT